LTDVLGRVTADLTGDGREDLAILVRTASGGQIRHVRAGKTGFGPAGSDRDLDWSTASPF